VHGLSTNVFEKKCIIEIRDLIDLVYGPTDNVGDWIGNDGRRKMMIQQITVPGDLELGDLASRVDDNLAVV
jgi:hypothetical protein